MSTHDSHPATDTAPWDPYADAAQPEGLRIPTQLIDAAHEQAVRDGAWAYIVSGETDEVEVAAEVMLLSDGTVDPAGAGSIAAFLLDSRREQLRGS